MERLCAHCAAPLTGKKRAARFCSIRCGKLAYHATQRRDPLALLEAQTVRDPATGCWNWTGHKARRGYGRIRVKGRVWITHRLSFFLHTGDDPGDLQVCHRCDNPPCWNPGHLFKGTVQDNSDDKVAKQRQSKGVAHGKAKITPVEVRFIRANYRQSMTADQIAAQVGISVQQVRNIAKRRVWAHVE